MALAPCKLNFFFWLRWVFVAAHRFSLVAGSGGYSLAAVLRPFTAAASLAEQEIFDQFATLSRGKISIFVSHRLWGAVGADKIFVLSHGEIAEVGNHRELMEKKGEYHRLFSTQAEKYQE